MQEQLTQREQEIFDALIAGKTPKEIAFDLNITYDTVKFHQKNLYIKLEVENIQELLVKYRSNSTKDPNTLLAEQPFPCPFDLTLNDNPPYGGFYCFDPDMFEYNGEHYPSPFKLGKGNRLIENEIYHASCYFTANVDLEFLLIYFMDTSIEEPVFSLISGLHKLGNMGLKANTRYNLSTKILVTRTAGSASPAANQFRLQSGSFAEDKRIITFHKFEVVKLPYLLNQITSQKEKIDNPKTLPVSRPLAITFEPDNRGSWGGWSFVLFPDVFEYNGKRTVSPFRLGRGRRIVEDDIFLVTLFFTSNVDMDFLQIEFIDTTLTEDNYWTQLSPYLQVKRNIKAGAENNVTIKLLATKSASGTSPAENQFKLEAGPGTKEQPTLTFTKFEVVKIN